VEYNLALGQRRANAARDYLISLGMGAGEVSTVSYGEERPLDPRQTEDAWAKNRRCHFVVLKR
jgi:peptidoglycan-associated lipoprotein